MTGPYRDHPTEDALERFLLQKSEEDELEIVETHILVCEMCVTRLETLEFNIEATKLALREYQQAEQAAKAIPSAPKPSFNLLNWLTPFRLTLAGASLAACALAITFASVPREITLTAYRGAETNYVSQWLPLELHLNATELPAGPAHIEVVDAQGAKVWNGQGTIQNDQIDIAIPRFTAAGQYFIRIYSNEADASASLLREFSVQTKSPF